MPADADMTKQRNQFRAFQFCLSRGGGFGMLWLQWHSPRYIQELSLTEVYTAELTVVYTMALTAVYRH